MGGVVGKGVMYYAMPSAEGMAGVSIARLPHCKR